MANQERPDVIPAGNVVTRDIPIGTAVTAADFGPGAEAAGPQEVHVGAGGDPLMIGIPIFLVGSIALGVNLITVAPFPLAGLVPLVLVGTAFFQFVSTIWAMLLGQGMVACIFGLFSGFWAGLATLLLGLGHNWFFPVPAAPPAAAAAAAVNVSNTQLTFFIAWDVIFFCLTIGTLRLPAIYPAIIALVVVAVTLVIFGIEFPGSIVTLFQAAGAAVLAFCALGVVVFMHIQSVSLGGPASPSLGPPVIK